MKNNKNNFNKSCMDYIKDAIIGSGSSSISAVLCSPLDVLKVQAQATPGNVRFMDLAKQIVGKQSYFGFGKGLIAALTTKPIFYGLYFPIVEHIKDVKHTKYKYVDKTINYLAAGSAGIVATNPLWVLKTRQQTLVTKKTRILHKTYPTLIKEMYHKEGIRSFYKGTISSLVKGSEIGIIFPLRDYLKDELGFSSMTSSFWGKSTAACITYPIDLIRTRQRDSTKPNQTMIGVGKQLVRAHNGNPLCLYRGLSLYMMNSIPQFVIMMMFYDYFQKKKMKIN